MNIKRGLIRLWIVISILWVVFGVSGYFFIGLSGHLLWPLISGFVPGAGGPVQPALLAG